MPGLSKREPSAEATDIFSRFDRMFSLPLPEGVTKADVTATYKAGVLEIRVPAPKRESAKKIAISRS